MALSRREPFKVGVGWAGAAGDLVVADVQVVEAVVAHAHLARGCRGLVGAAVEARGAGTVLASRTGKARPVAGAAVVVAARAFALAGCEVDGAVVVACAAEFVLISNHVFVRVVRTRHAVASGVTFEISNSARALRAGQPRAVGVVTWERILVASGALRASCYCGIEVVSSKRVLAVGTGHARRLRVVDVCKLVAGLALARVAAGLGGLVLRVGVLVAGAAGGHAAVLPSVRGTVCAGDAVAALAVRAGSAGVPVAGVAD